MFLRLQEIYRIEGTYAYETHVTLCDKERKLHQITIPKHYEKADVATERIRKVWFRHQSNFNTLQA